MSKYTTIAQIKADIKISYAKILDFYSEIQADTHGMAYLIVEMKDNTTLAELEALYFTPAVITDMEGKNIYSGICVSVAIENQDGYQKLILELKDKLKLEDAFEKKLAHEQEAAVLAGADFHDGRQEAVEALTALGYSSVLADMSQIV